MFLLFWEASPIIAEVVKFFLTKFVKIIYNLIIWSKLKKIRKYRYGEEVIFNV